MSRIQYTDDSDSENIEKDKLQIHTTAGLIIDAIANKLVNIEDIQQ